MCYARKLCCKCKSVRGPCRWRSVVYAPSLSVSIVFCSEGSVAAWQGAATPHSIASCSEGRQARGKDRRSAGHRAQHSRRGWQGAATSHSIALCSEGRQARGKERRSGGHRAQRNTAEEAGCRAIELQVQMRERPLLKGSMCVLPFFTLTFHSFIHSHRQRSERHEGGVQRLVWV